MDASKNPALLMILEIVSRLRRWWCMPIVGVCLGVAAGLVVYDRLPKTYEAKTVILVKPPLISRDVLPTPITEGMVTHIRALAPSVLSREYLTTLVDDVYGQNVPSESRERLMMGIRGRLTIPMPNIDDRLETGTFELLFTDRDPELAAKVVNYLAELFIAEYVRGRTADAKEVVARFQDSVDQEEAAYSEQELSIQRFRNRHRNELAENQQANSTMLEMRSKDLDRVKEEILAAEQRLKDLRTERRSTSSLVGEVSSGLTATEELAAQVTRLREELAALLLRYTDQHPQVQAKRTDLAAKEQELARRMQDDAAEDSGESGGTGLAGMGIAHPLDSQINAAEREIERLNRERDRIEREIREFEGWLKGSGSVQEQLAQLERGFESRKDNLERMRQKLDLARTSLELQESRGKERFQIIDRARPPVIPASPNQLIVFGGSVVGGILLFVGPIALIQLLRPVVMSRAALMQATSAPVLVAINEVKTSRIVRKRRWRVSWNVIGTAASLVLVAVVIFNFM